MISEAEVSKISKLARLKLTKEEVSKMQKDLSKVLDYFNLLKKAKARTKKDLLNASEQKKIMRQDHPEPQSPALVKKLLEAAPDKKGSHIKVKPIL